MYSYEEQKPRIFTEEGQRAFLAIRDNAHKLLALAGAFRTQEAVGAIGGSSWVQLACIDRLVELGEIREITEPGVAGQYRN